MPANTAISCYSPSPTLANMIKFRNDTMSVYSRITEVDNQWTYARVKPVYLVNRGGMEGVAEKNEWVSFRDYFVSYILRNCQHGTNL